MMAAAVLLAGHAAGEGTKQPRIFWQRAAEFGVTPALASLPAEMLVPPGGGQGEDRFITRRNQRRARAVRPRAGAGEGPFQDPLVGLRTARPDAMPAPTLTFDGMAAIDFAQPDTALDVGPGHVVELVNNTRIQVFDKAGTSLLGPASVRTLFIGLPAASPCRAGGDDGNPTVLYDPLADRWLVSQFEVSAFPNYQCVAISQTGDPTGAYYAYAFRMPEPPAIPEDRFQDYPHYGVWPDAYYLTTEQSDSFGTTPLGSGAFAFDRARMIAGDPTAAYVYVDLFPLDPSASGLLPTDLDGYLPPPSGLPQLLMERRADESGDPSDAVRPYEFVPNFATPSASTFTVRPDIVLAPFDAREPSGRADLEQFGGENLDSMADRLMVRLAYRNLGSSTVPANSWVGNFTVNVSGVNPTNAATYQAGIRWFELHSAGASLPTLFDQGTHNLGPIDGATGPNNWMGSIAQDNQGSLALGFSQASSTQRADIKIAGRTGAAATGALSAGEGLFYAATGSQAANTFNRWGDYSSMSVDPADDCTFWYAQEYYATTASFAWRTRIGSFVYPGCTPAPRGALEVTVTNCVGGAAVPGALVTATGGFVGVTNGSGVASFTTAPGDYTVSASRAGYSAGTANATVSSGGTTSVGVCVTAIPIMVAAGSSLLAETCSAANNRIDPGEAVTVSLCVGNSGAADTVSLVGTLQASGGVTSPGPGQSYGVVAAGGAPACANHDFVASAALSCGASLTASMDLVDGVTSLGTVAYSFVTGGTASSSPYGENFDGVTAPALPAGWVQAVTGTTPPPAWATTTTAGFFVSAPNGAATGSSAAVSGATLDSPSIAIPAFNTVQLSFQNNYSLETGWDGGVLEIGVDGGAFTDILTAGGSWVTGGYNRTLSSSGNPLTGRPAWSGTGTSGTNGLFITTTVNLPASVGGHSIVLRWRSGFDSSTSPAGAGWRLDDIALTLTRPVCSVSCTAPSDLIFKDGMQTP